MREGLSLFLGLVSFQTFAIIWLKEKTASWLNLIVSDLKYSTVQSRFFSKSSGLEVYF